jgi:hypothetical protein
MPQRPNIPTVPRPASEEDPSMKSSTDIIRAAQSLGIGLPAFNIAHLPMTEPVIRAVADQDSFALVEVSRIDWMKFGAKSPRAVIDEFNKWKKVDHVRIHLDHVPVIDEDGKRVDYRAVISEAISLGYQSVMVDASRLPLEENIRVTREVSDLAHAAGIPVESELGAVLGHEAGPLPPYEELFASGKGFTRPDEGHGSFANPDATGSRWPSAISTALSRRPPATRRRSRHDWLSTTWRSWQKPRGCPSSCTAARASSRSTFSSR